MQNHDSKIAIVYHSAAGHTHKLARLVAQGASVEQAKVDLVEVSGSGEVDWAVLDAADAIIFGAPTFMGGVSAPFKAFIDRTGDFWLEQRWLNKIGAGFTIGSAQSGDKLGTLMQMAFLACQHGMVWVGQAEVGSLYTKDGKHINETGSWLGLMATSSRDKSQLISAGDALTAEIFGRRVAMVTKSLK